jgi:hypothetical protein
VRRKTPEAVREFGDAQIRQIDRLKAGSGSPNHRPRSRGVVAIQLRGSRDQGDSPRTGNKPQRVANRIREIGIQQDPRNIGLRSDASIFAGGDRAENDRQVVSEIPANQQQRLQRRGAHRDQNVEPDPLVFFGEPL